MTTAIRLVKDVDVPAKVEAPYLVTHIMVAACFLTPGLT